jgi:hypothetical protein
MVARSVTDAVDVAAITQSVMTRLCYALRGRMSRLYLRIELAPLENALKSLMLEELVDMDAQLSTHRALLQGPPQRPSEAISVCQVVEPLLQEPRFQAKVHSDIAAEHVLHVWPEILLGALHPLR